MDEHTYYVSLYALTALIDVLCAFVSFHFILFYVILLDLTGVKVLGCIFNKLPLEGFYNVQACKEAVSSYFTRHGSIYCPYGFIPILTVSSSNENTVEMSGDGTDLGSIIPTAGDETLKTATATSETPIAKAASLTAEALVDAFLHHVDFNQLLCDVFKHHVSLSTISNPLCSLSCNSFSDTFARYYSSTYTPLL